ncbi:MAG: hypothetical protein WBG11_15105 [Methylocella sp.]
MAAIRLNFSFKALPNRLAHLIEDEPLKSKGLQLVIESFGNLSTVC